MRDGPFPPAASVPGRAEMDAAFTALGAGVAVVALAVWASAQFGAKEAFA